MIVPSDESYQQTKRIKLEGQSLAPPFQEMATWITKTYGVSVINILYETTIPNGSPRIQVVVETEIDLSRLCPGVLSSFTEIDKRRVREQFTLIASKCSAAQIVTDGLSVIFSAFERVAKIEAMSRVPDAHLDDLRERLQYPTLWKIVKSFGSVTFFFFATHQIKEFEHSGLREVWTREFSALLGPYDEFGFFELHPPVLALDSKENFEKNYNGRWFNYFR